MRETILMFQRDIVIFDLEATGDNPSRHEIIEIGAVRMRRTGAVVGKYSQKCVPLYPKRAMPEAVAVNGYTAKAWRSALPLRMVLKKFARFSRGSILAAYNITFDWEFLHTALTKHRVSLDCDYHRLDIFSIAQFDAMARSARAPLTLAASCKRFSIPLPPKPHQALEDARAAALLLIALTQKQRRARKI